MASRHAATSNADALRTSRSPPPEDGSFETVRMSPRPAEFPTVDRRTTIELANIGMTPWLAPERDLLRGLARIDKEVAKNASRSQASIETDILPWLQNLRAVLSPDVAIVTAKGEMDDRQITNLRRQLRALEENVSQVRDTLAWISRKSMDSQELLDQRLQVHAQTRNVVRMNDDKRDREIVRQVGELHEKSLKKINRQQKSINQGVQNFEYRVTRQLRNIKARVVRLQAQTDPHKVVLPKLGQIEAMLGAVHGSSQATGANGERAERSGHEQAEINPDNIQGLLDAQLRQEQGGIYYSQSFQEDAMMDTDSEIDSENDTSMLSDSVSESEEDEDLESRGKHAKRDRDRKKGKISSRSAKDSD